MNAERKEKLLSISSYLAKKSEQNKDINLVFICIQNSRRSHLSQVIAQHIALQHQFNNIYCYSGGVEVTQIHPNTVNTLKHLGYSLTLKKDGENPVYELHYPEYNRSLLLYSKDFKEVTEKLKTFAAIMVCSESETNCPYVPNAEKIIHLPYPDPKEFDETPTSLNEYLKISNQIKEEWSFIFSSVNHIIYL
ncbi:MAG: protein-tyrosine-phosphatase [Bacteroidia bacterium]|nr:protein-tyrosine-phosphatase [Bacteroidia bacterium]